MHNGQPLERPSFRDVAALHLCTCICMLTSAGVTWPRSPCGMLTTSCLGVTSTTAPHSRAPAARFCASMIVFLVQTTREGQILLGAVYLQQTLSSTQLGGGAAWWRHHSHKTALPQKVP